MENTRNNEEWLKALGGSEAQRDAALADLQALLLRTLPRGLSRWLSPQDPQFESLVEDTVQDTLLRVMDKLDTFEGRSQFTTWVYKIAVRLGLNELRRRRWRDRSLEGLSGEDDSSEQVPRQFAAPERGPEALVERADMLERVERLVAEELTEKQRAAMMAISVQGVPMEVVAERMGTNRNALYKLLFDARVRLKHRLESEGLSPGELLEMFSSE
jgi:RNA polymerase sigma-70 factor (ECF subfamily)